MGRNIHSLSSFLGPDQLFYYFIMLWMGLPQPGKISMYLSQKSVGTVSL